MLVGLGHLFRVLCFLKQNPHCPLLFSGVLNCMPSTHQSANFSSTYFVRFLIKSLCPHLLPSMQGAPRKTISSYNLHAYCAYLISDLSRAFVGLCNDRSGVWGENTKPLFFTNDLLGIRYCQTHWKPINLHTFLLMWPNYRMNWIH